MCVLVCIPNAILVRIQRSLVRDLLERVPGR